MITGSQMDPQQCLIVISLVSYSPIPHRVYYSVSVRMPLLASVNNPTHTDIFCVGGIGSESNVWEYLAESGATKLSGPLSSHLLVLCSPGLLPRYIKVDSSSSRLTSYHLGAPEKKCAFSPRSFFFPSGFIESSGIGFHWIEAIANARVMLRLARPGHSHTRI